MKQNKIPRNEYIIKPKGKIDPYKDDVQYGKSGQLRYPYQVTKIPGDTMSTEGYGNIPLWTVPDVGPPRMVYPNTGNQFFAGANNFTEYPMKSPMARYGGSFDMYPFGGIHTKTDTHMSKGGWLDSYEPGGEKPWGEMTAQERAAYLDAKEANTKAETTSRKQATKEHYQDYVKDSMKKTLEHPIFNTAQYFTPEGMAIGAIKGLANVGPDVAKGDYSAAAFDALTALPAVAPAVKNAYRVNPWAEKLNNPKSSYRVAGLDAGEDFKKTGALRSQIPDIPKEATLQERAMNRPTAFPSFQKGYADLNYLPDEGGVIFKTDLPTFKRGELNPVTGFPIKGRHYAHRVIDPKTGAAVTNIPGADVKMYGSEPHWLKGYKEVPVELPGSPNGLQNTYIHPTGKMEGIGDIKDIKRSLMREDQYLKPSEYNSKAIPFSSYKPQAGGYTDVPEFNQELNNMLTKLQYGKRPTLTKENFYNKEELNKLTKQYKDYHAALNEYEKANPQSGASMMMGMFSNENPYMNTFHNLNPNLKEPNWGEKFWGHLDDTKELNTYLPNAPGVRTPLSPDALKYMGSSENKLVPTAKNLVDNPNEWFHKTNKKDYVNEMRGSLNLKLSDIQNMSEKELETTAQKIFNKIENQKKERYLKDVSTPYTGLDAYQNLQPNKYGGFNKKEGGWLDEYQTGGKIDMSKVKMNYFPKSNVEAQSRLDEEKAWENDYYRQQDKDYQNEVNAAVKKGIPRKQAELVIKKYKTEPQEQSTVVAHTPQGKLSKALEVATNPVLAMKNYKGHRLPDNFSSNAEEDLFSPSSVSNLGYQFLSLPGKMAFATSSGDEAVKNVKDKDYLMAGVNAAFSAPVFSPLKGLNKLKKSGTLNKASKLLSAAPENNFTYRGVVEPFEGSTKLVKDEANAYYDFLQERQNPYLAGQWKNEYKEFKKQYPVTSKSSTGIIEKPSDPEYYKNFLVNGKSIPSSKELPGSPNVHKSEIDWKAWNKEIPKNKALMNEYNAIEESSKANNTWMKNPDGSAFQGTPEQFVQQSSNNFKNAFPEGHNRVYRGGNNETLKDRAHPIVFTANKEVGEHYVGSKSPYTGEYETASPDARGGRVLFDMYHPKSNNNITINNQGRSWREIPRKYFGDNPPPRDLHNPKGDFTSTDDIAKWMVENDKNSVRLNNIFDSYDADFVDIINHKKGNYLKSAVGNNGMFDMTNPNIYKSVVPIGLGAAALQQEKLGGWLDDEEFRRGGQKGLKKYTSKNIQSSVNDIMLRNETLFGPAGKRRYKPNLKYKDGGWLDNMY